MAATLSQSFDPLVIPVAELTDPEPVKSNLSLAASSLARGDMREALRLLRRAAEVADDAGSEPRAVALARAAADLATEIGASRAPPPVQETEPSVAVTTSPPVSMRRGSADAALQQLLDSGRAVRVVVKRSTRDEGLFVVRRAAEGAPPLGAREAVVVLLDPDDGFFTPGA